MKSLIISLWTDPKAAMGFLMVIASIVSMIMLSQQPLAMSIGLALGQLSGGMLLWHSKTPGQAEPTTPPVSPVTVISPVTPVILPPAPPAPPEPPKAAMILPAILVLLLLTPFLSACAGLQRIESHGIIGGAAISKAEMSARCASLQSQYRLWGAVAIVSGALAGGGGLVAAFPDDKTLRTGVAIGSVIDAAIGAAAVFLRDSVTNDFRQDCETLTATTSGK